MLLMDGILAPALTKPPAVIDRSSTGWKRLVQVGREEFWWHSARWKEFVYVQLQGVGG